MWSEGHAGPLPPLMPHLITTSTINILICHVVGRLVLVRILNMDPRRHLSLHSNALIEHHVGHWHDAKGMSRT